MRERVGHLHKICKFRTYSQVRELLKIYVLTGTEHSFAKLGIQATLENIFRITYKRTDPQHSRKPLIYMMSINTLNLILIPNKACIVTTTVPEKKDSRRNK